MQKNDIDSLLESYMAYLGFNTFPTHEPSEREKRKENHKIQTLYHRQITGLEPQNEVQDRKRVERPKEVKRKKKRRKNYKIFKGFHRKKFTKMFITIKLS